MSQLSGPGGTNIGLISSRAVNDLAFAHCFVTREPVDKIFISSKTSTNAYVFPLFLSDDDGLFAESPRPNLSNAFLARLSAAVGLERVGEYGMPQDVPAEHIFQFAYAVLHSPAYRERYGEFLRIDFPRLPLTTNLVLFRRLAELGGELIAVHLLESPTLDQPVTTYVGASNPTVERIGWSNDTVWIDAPATRKGEPSIAGTAGFVGVSVEVWNFHVGGYQVCEKWLKDRKGRTLSIEDTILYQKIIVSLSETLRLMNEVDEVIEKHGGWPAAFAQTP